MYISENGRGITNKLIWKVSLEFVNLMDMGSQPKTGPTPSQFQALLGNRDNYWWVKGYSPHNNGRGFQRLLSDGSKVPLEKYP